MFPRGFKDKTVKDNAKDGSLVVSFSEIFKGSIRAICYIELLFCGSR